MDYQSKRLFRFTNMLLMGNKLIIGLKSFVGLILILTVFTIFLTYYPIRGPLFSMFQYGSSIQILMATGIWSADLAYFCQLRSRKIPTYDFFSVHRESLLPFFTAFLTIRYLVIKLRVACATVNDHCWKKKVKLPESEDACTNI